MMLRSFGVQVDLAGCAVYLGLGWGPEYKPQNSTALSIRTRTEKTHGLSQTTMKPAPGAEFKGSCAAVGQHQAI